MNPLSHPPAMDIMVIGDTPDALDAVLGDGVAIAIWARPRLPDAGRRLHDLAHGDAFDIVAEGTEADAALAALVALVANRFDEDE